MKKSIVLNTRERNSLLRHYPKWSVSNNATKLTRKYSFKRHIDALAFIARVSVHAVVLDHYPEIVFTHEKVKITLSTPSVKGITKVDVVLLERIEHVSE